MLFRSNFYASDSCNPPGRKIHFIVHDKANALFYFIFAENWFLSCSLHWNEYMLLAH